MFAVAVAEPVPMTELNTTPLIDVMLVLLVMMIITIPPPSHVVNVESPGPPPIVAVDRVKNRLVVTAAGATLWNGTPVAQRTLRGLLETSARMEPAPELHFQPDAAARYARVDEVLAMSKQAGVTSMGFVGNEAYLKVF